MKRLTMPGPSYDTLYLPESGRWPVDPSTGAGAADGSSSSWLTAGEQVELAMLTDAGRRRQWLAGRFAAKQLVVRSRLADRPGDVEIRSRDVLRRGSRPSIRVGGRPLAGSLSIAHTPRGVLVALAKKEQTEVGVDLIDLTADGLDQVAAGGGFAKLWFTTLERSWIAADPLWRVATLWGVKEAVYKACHRGEAWSPRDITVWPRKLPAAGGGFRCFYRGQAIAGLAVEIRQLDDHLAAIATVTGSTTAATRRTGKLFFSHFLDNRQPPITLGTAI